MIQVKNLSKFYGEHELFDEVNLTIAPREKIGLIGRNGTGKSTFIRILNGSEVPDDGEVEIPKSLRVQSLEQHLDFTEPSILQQASLALPPEESDQTWQAESVLMGLGFTKEDFSRAPEEFSSGMQVRLRLAQALVSKADLLLLDEPTNYLDILSLRWLERFLKTWKGTFVLVTHDQTFMEKVVSHVVAIHRGKMRKMPGTPQKLMSQIQKEEEIHERTRVKQEKKDAKTKEFIRNFRAGARSAGLVQSRIKSLAKQKVHKKLDKLPQIRFDFRSQPFTGGELIKATNLSFTFEENTPLINKFSIAVRPGERIAIIGPNGKGKSTLLRLLTEELAAKSGKLKHHENLRLGYFGPSQIKALSPQNTILAELMSLPKSKEQKVRSICGALLFTGNSVKKQIGNLSGGEKSRVGLAKLMLSEHNLLILDEPTNHLDMESCRALTTALQDFKGTVIFVSHDERMIRQLATRLVIFDGGEIQVLERTYDRFLELGGWQNEQEHWAKPKLSRPSQSKEDYLKRKETQKELRQAQKEQKKLEKKIEELELQQELNTKELSKAYEQKHMQNMLDYGAAAKRLLEEIDAAYKSLEELMGKEITLKEKLGVN